MSHYNPIWRNPFQQKVQDHFEGKTTGPTDYVAIQAIHQQINGNQAAIRATEAQRIAVTLPAFTPPVTQTEPAISHWIF